MPSSRTDLLILFNKKTLPPPGPTSTPTRHLFLKLAFHCTCRTPAFKTFEDSAANTHIHIGHGTAQNLEHEYEYVGYRYYYPTFSWETADSALAPHSRPHPNPPSLICLRFRGVGPCARYFGPSACVGSVWGWGRDGPFDS